MLLQIFDILQSDVALQKQVHKNWVLLQERDGYKRIIDSYESEVTLNVGAGSLNRVQHLEENMKAYRKQTELLESELNKVNDELATSRQYCKQVRANRLTELLESELNKVNDELATSR